MFECDCGHRWRVLSAHRNSPYSGKCPHCGGDPSEALAAPGLNRGAPPQTAQTIPTDKTKAIDFAMRAIAEDNHVSNMKSSLKVGETAAIETPVPKGAGFISMETASALGTADPYRDRNLSLIDSIATQPGKMSRQDTLRPVYRTPRK
jgi:hypothetical protein